LASTPIDLRPRGGKADATFRWASLLAGFLVLLILALILLTMTRHSKDVFDLMGLRFFTGRTWSPATNVFGALPFIYGTLVTATIALVLSVPLSIGIALFVTQVAPLWLRRPMVWLMDLLAVIPSVVFGLWGLLVLSGKLVPVYNGIHDTLGHIPILGKLFGEPSQSGRAFFTAGIILAVMITPIIVSLSREVIETTPTGEKEAAYALGATRWEMIRGSVLPHAKGGLVGAVMLGLGRAMGETIAAALVIGSVAQITPNVFATGDSMPAVIVNQWGEASSIHKSALIGLAVVLFLMTIVVNMVANFIVQRSLARSRGVGG
jgi:phosphate transport system permease protein